MQHAPGGSELVGAISFGKLSSAMNDVGKNPEKNPVSYEISYIVPPIQVMSADIFDNFNLLWSENVIIFDYACVNLL